MNFLRWLDKNFEGTVAGILMAAIVALISLNVFMRYVLDASLSWGEELTLWTFVWFVWLSASYAFRHRKHVRITILRDMLGDRGQIGLDLVVDILILIFLGVLAFECLKLINLPFVASQKSVVLGLPIPILYASAPVGAALSSIRVLQHLFIQFGAMRQTET
jgi:TRAP-type C4-dicarboxylate transport system permease small subunit